VAIRIEFETFAQMAFAEHDDVIDAFAANRADEAFDISILPRRPGRDGPIADTDYGEPLPDDVPIEGVAVAEQVLRCLLPGKGFGDLPRNSFGRGMGCDRH
jgi:hypothetical protein